MDFSRTPLIPNGNHPDAYLQGLPLLPGAKVPVRNRSANAIRASPNTKWHLCLTNAVLFFNGRNLKKQKQKKQCLAAGEQQQPLHVFSLPVC